MLDDQDRNVKYAEAIKRCVDCFATREGRMPRVLDVGVGTGLLSAICLEAGVEHVTAVDVNETMANLASRNLRELDPSRRRHQVVLVEPGKMPFEEDVRRPATSARCRVRCPRTRRVRQGRRALAHPAKLRAGRTPRVMPRGQLAQCTRRTHAPLTRAHTPTPLHAHTHRLHARPGREPSGGSDRVRPQPVRPARARMG